MPYKLLDHPAELRVRIWAKTKEELFKEAALALASIQKKSITLFRRSFKKCYTEEVIVESTDINSLLVDFLNEILARSQINKCVYSVSDLTLNPTIGSEKKVNAKHLFSASEPIDETKFHKPYTLIAVLIGYAVDHFDEDIKAVTYQDVDMRQKICDLRNKKKLWQTIIVFDI